MTNENNKIDPGDKTVNLEGDSIQATQTPQAREGKDLFLAKIVHELRTPLQTVLSSVEILSDSYESQNAPSRRALDRLNIACDQIIRHIDDLALFARYQSGVPRICITQVNIPRLVKEVVDEQSEVASARNTTIDTNIVDSDCFIDELRVRQIITNLLSNAIKSTHSGKINVSVSVDSDDPKSPILSIVVSDTGSGIDSQFHSVVFQPFARFSQFTGNSGSGLGLSIVKTIVDRLDGTVRFESSASSGTTFYIQLPLSTHAD